MDSVLLQVILNPPDTTRVHFSDELLVLGDGSPVASSEEFQDEISASMESGKGSPPDWQRLKASSFGLGVSVYADR